MPHYDDEDYRSEESQPDITGELPIAELAEATRKIRGSTDAAPSPVTDPRPIEYIVSDHAKKIDALERTAIADHVTVFDRLDALETLVGALADAVRNTAISEKQDSISLKRLAEIADVGGSLYDAYSSEVV